MAPVFAAVPAVAQQICSPAWEWIEADNDNGRIELSCPNGGVIYWIDFASYGTPNPVPFGYDPDDFTATSQSNPTLAPVCARSRVHLGRGRRGGLPRPVVVRGRGLQ